jgi:hypothetical protein
MAPPVDVMSPPAEHEVSWWLVWVIDAWSPVTLPELSLNDTFRHAPPPFDPTIEPPAEHVRYWFPS